MADYLQIEADLEKSVDGVQAMQLQQAKAASQAEDAHFLSVISQGRPDYDRLKELGLIRSDTSLEDWAASRYMMTKSRSDAAAAGYYQTRQMVFGPAGEPNGQILQAVRGRAIADAEGMKSSEIMQRYGNLGLTDAEEKQWADKVKAEQTERWM